jgi:arylsulfatase
MRTWRILLAAALVAALAGCGRDAPAGDAPPAGADTGGPREGRPNVVLVVVDSLRADALSIHGYARQTSPRLDAFGRENIVFDDAHTVAAATAPAMAALMTGRLPYYEAGTFWTTLTSYGLHRFFASESEAGVPQGLDTLAEVLKRHGYATAGFVTNSHLKQIFHFHHGFDVFGELMEPAAPRADPLPYGPADELTRGAIEWLRGAGAGPFFLFLHYMDVHDPYLPPPEYRALFEHARVEGRSDAQIQPVWLAGEHLDASEHRHIGEHMRGLYDASVRYTDHWIGELLDELRRAGRWDDTLVVVTSDHGEEFLEHGGTIHKGTMYQELMRVPLLLRVPGRGPARIPVPVRNFDVMPTILDLAVGGDLPPELDAVSLRRLVEGVPGADSGALVASFPLMPAWEATRVVSDGRFKLLDRPLVPEQGELYDLREDPREQTNLYALRPELVSRLRGELALAFDKPAREAAASSFDVSLLQAGAQEEFDRLSKQALAEMPREEEVRHVERYFDRLTPAERDALVEQALQQMSPEEQRRLIQQELDKREKRPGVHEGVDPETAEQLRAIGYLD